MTETAAPAVTPAVTPAATPAPAAPAVAKDERNGVTRPKTGTQTGTVWDICDKLSKETGKPAERKPVVDHCTAAGINPSTAATQYGKWRKYHGLVSEKTVVPTPVAGAVQPEAPIPAEAPAAETPEPA